MFDGTTILAIRHGGKVVVVGDGQGRVGYGSGKAKEVPSAIKKGIEVAKKNMIPIAMDGTTIPHAALGRYGAGRVRMEIDEAGYAAYMARKRQNCEAQSAEAVVSEFLAKGEPLTKQLRSNAPVYHVASRNRLDRQAYVVTQLDG